MKYRIILGIVLPVVLIVLLGILGSSQSGLTSSKEYYPEVKISSIFQEQSIKSYIEIGQISLKNENFLSKKYILDQLSACLVDSEGVKSPINAGEVIYSDEESLLTSRDIFGRQYMGEKTTTVNSKSEKNVKIYIVPQSYFTYLTPTQLNTQYGEYDSVVLVKKETSNSQNYYYNSYDYYSKCSIPEIESNKVASIAIIRN